MRKQGYLKIGTQSKLMYENRIYPSCHIGVPFRLIHLR